VSLYHPVMTIPHDVLHSKYEETGSLRYYVERWIGSFPLKKQIRAIKQAQLKREVLGILSEIWVAEFRYATTATPTVQPRYPSVSGDLKLTWSQLIELTIQRILRSGNKNLLTIGYRRRRVTLTPDGPISSIEATYPNTLVNTLKSPAWEWLHNVTGDAFIIRLLSESSLFVRLKHNCYFQLTGCPIYERVKHGEPLVDKNVVTQNRSER
jgi:hypothetical protein